MQSQKQDRQYLEIPINSITPDPEQPRKDINEATLLELAESIKAMGVEQPINVRIHPNNPEYYMIISGERRWRASKLAGLTVIPAILREEMETVDLKRRQLAENYHRDNFNRVEEAEFLQRWVHLLLSQGVESPQIIIAQELGISQSLLSRKLAVLKYAEEVRAVVRDGLVRDKDALATLNRLKEEDRARVIAKVKKGEFNFKEFKKNERRILKELKAETEKPVKKTEEPSIEETQEKTSKKIITRWGLSRKSIISLMHNSEYVVMVQEHDLDNVSDETLLDLFNKFKEWIDDENK
ncbi:MAG: ParB/RepB/Spo0J family partition protein [Pseudomonadales bacterium]|nr:ParB/RepB/Spo0J family partition protein [Pseudomonadales bacterium]HMX99483.1 ParB/RepB/Spo0J family partition protein [Agitococcus sp.]